MRAGRLVSLLRLLQSHGRMTARRLAEELEVSERTILRDMEALSGAGVPVYGVRGAGGGFELLGPPVDDLPMPASGLNRPSATARRAGLRVSVRGRRLIALLGKPPGLRLQPTSRQVDDWVAASVQIESIEAAVLELLALGADVEVISPPELRRAMHETAARIAALHA